MNIFAYRGRYRTVTGTRYTVVQVCPTAKYACISPGAKPSATLQTERHAYNAWKRELSISLQTRDVHSVARACMPVYLLGRGISRLALSCWPVKPIVRACMHVCVVCGSADAVCMRRNKTLPILCIRNGTNARARSPGTWGKGYFRTRFEL